MIKLINKSILLFSITLSALGCSEFGGDCPIDTRKSTRCALMVQEGDTVTITTYENGENLFIFDPENSKTLNIISNSRKGITINTSASIVNTHIPHPYRSFDSIYPLFLKIGKHSSPR